MTNGESVYEYFTIEDIDQLPDGERLFVEINDEPIVVINISGQYYAIGDVCTHDNGPLGDGEVEDNSIVCPRHGAKFDIRNGKALTLPAVKNTPTYPVRVINNQIQIGIKTT